MNIRILFGVVVVLMLFGAYNAFAISKDDIVYPIAELGLCENKEQCRAYCDDVVHGNECLNFAQQHNLMPAEEIEEARRFVERGIFEGPGGCRGRVQCEAYCEDVNHLDECLAFANEHDLIDEEEREEAQKVAQALRQGAQLPGGCTSKASCEAYCEDGNHIEECLAFAEAAGFIEPDELEEARRIAPLMARGEMPGGCRSRQQCETYCADSANTNECASFFEAAGFITTEEVEMFRKTGGKGPGNCQGREECESFCNNPANQQACFEFAKEHGILEEEEVHNIENGVSRIREGLDNAPPEVRECLHASVGETRLQRILRDELLPSQEIGEHMRRCFEQHATESIEHQIRQSMGDVPPEAVDCIQRILGDAQGPATPEQEQHIGQECFPHKPGQNERNGDFEGEFPHEDRREFYDDEFQDDFDERYREGEFYEGEFQDGEFIQGVPDQFQREYQEQYEERYEEQFSDEFQVQFEEEYQKQHEEIQDQYEQEFQQQFLPELEDGAPDTTYIEGDTYLHSQEPEVTIVPDTQYQDEQYRNTGEFQQGDQYNDASFVPPQEYTDTAPVHDSGDVSDAGGTQDTPPDQSTGELQTRVFQESFLGSVADAVAPAVKHLLLLVF